jgi:hypothetical protein
MRRKKSGRAFVLSAAAVLLAAGAASAQTNAGGSSPSRPFAPRGGFYTDHQPQPIPRVVPPRQPTSPAGSLLDQDMQIMRGGSLNPNGFLYGQWNPRVEYYYPPTYNNNFPGYGYGYGYPSGGGFYYGGALGYGGSGFNFGYGQQPQVLQREVYVIRERAAEAARQPEPQPRREEAPRAERPRSEGDFYLKNPGTGENISDALDDIRKAWLNGDFARMKARFKSEGEVRVLLNGEFKYAVKSSDFLAIVKDAMTKIDTVAFEFDRPKSETQGKASVTGRHTFVDPSKAKQEVPISYTLERVDGKWKIVEAGSSDKPAAR